MVYCSCTVRVRVRAHAHVLVLVAITPRGPLIYGVFSVIACTSTRCWNLCSPSVKPAAPQCEHGPAYLLQGKMRRRGIPSLNLHTTHCDTECLRMDARPVFRQPQISQTSTIPLSIEINGCACYEVGARMLTSFEIDGDFANDVQV